MIDSPLVQITTGDDRVVRVARTAVRIGSAIELEGMIAVARQRLQAVPRSAWAVLLDLRRAALPDETMYASEMRAFRREVTLGFRRAACLVETRVGQLQVQRFLREESIAAPVFTDEATALAFLTQP